MVQKNPPIKALFDNVHLLNAEQIIAAPAFKQLLKSQVVPCIRLAFKGNKLFATIFEINSTGNFIEIQKKDWIKALNSCMAWYVEDEDYAACNSIKGLITDIEGKTSN